MEPGKNKIMRPNTLLGKSIVPTREVKYLGVTFGSSMNFVTHVNNVVNRSITALFASRNLFSKI